MKMNKSLGVIIIIVILGIGAFVFLNMNDEIAEMDEAMEMKEGMMEKDDEAMMENNGDGESVDSAMDEDFAGAGQYLSYTTQNFEMNSDTDRVIFFHAGWCPTCKTLDANLTASASDIPGDLTILRADYDDEVALKKQYGVTFQHTLVQVDSNGDLLNKWSGSPDLDAVLSALQ